MQLHIELLCFQKADVLDTLGTLKDVLTSFEKKWEEVPLDLENGTFYLPEVWNQGLVSRQLGDTIQ